MELIAWNCSIYFNGAFLLQMCTWGRQVVLIKTSHYSLPTRHNNTFNFIPWTCIAFSVLKHFNRLPDRQISASMYTDMYYNALFIDNLAVKLFYLSFFSIYPIFKYTTEITKKNNLVKNKSCSKNSRNYKNSEVSWLLEVS